MSDRKYPTPKLAHGVKYDDNKLRYDLVPVEAHEGLAEVLTYGALKYDDDNWKKVPQYRYEAALFRHINAWRKGEVVDSESNIHHLKHALANLSFLLWFDLQKRDKL